ncbi:hypothetical protein HDU98_000819 [Podochytrium sp. JEL0797]|nr:hypothetical protein HDU98_000819 [Podochytrium sp. JEL0797]
MEYKSLLAACLPHSVGGNGNLNGHKLLKAGVPVCRLVLAKTRGGTDELVVVFSFSHAIVDGPLSVSEEATLRHAAMWILDAIVATLRICTI